MRWWTLSFSKTIFGSPEGGGAGAAVQAGPASSPTMARLVPPCRAARGRRPPARSAPVGQPHDPPAGNEERRGQRRGAGPAVRDLPADVVADAERRQEDADQATPDVNRGSEVGGQHATADDLPAHQRRAGAEHHHPQDHRTASSEYWWQ